ncbi:MAG TPA: dTMP kinase [Thermoanaerobaculia bacterium]|nr:dTMP kinase [Thermoanaerobaculia bacterium]
MAGLFLTFEGLDGSGKSTHLGRVARWLSAHERACRVTHEPGGTALGDAIRRAFLEAEPGPADGRVELLLVFASRRQHLLEVIEPALAAGEVVLCDRFTDSTVAYQGHGRGVAADEIARLDALATGGRRPDRTLLFDLPAEEARRRGDSHERRRRGRANRIDREELAFYERVREGYLALAAGEPERFRVIDSSGPREATEARVRAALADLFPALAAEAGGELAAAAGVAAPG